MNPESDNVCRPGDAIKSGQHDGERYEQPVPDTLDLAERASFALNALAESADAEHHWEPYQTGHFDQKPPYVNYAWQGPCLPKAIQAIPMMRVMSGSTQNQGVEVKMLENMLRDVEEDGLWWQKVKGRPWRKKTFKTDQVWPCAQGRLMEALTQWHALDGDERWLKVVAGMARGLGRISLRSEDRAWFHTAYRRTGWQGNETPSLELTGEAGGPAGSEPEGESPYNIGLPLRGLAGFKSHLEHGGAPVALSEVGDWRVPALGPSRFGSVQFVW